MGGGTAVTNQATIKEVSTSNDFENALKDSSVEEIHITGDFTYNRGVDADKKIVIEEGKTFTILSNSMGTIAVKGSIVNDGTIKISGSFTCIWTATTTGKGKISADNQMWSKYSTYVDYGSVPDEMLVGSNCWINIITAQPSVYLPQNMKTGDTIKPDVTNLIDGVNIAEVFDFEWKNGSSNKIYNGAANPTLTEAGTLKLTLSPKTPYVMRTSSGTRGSIETSGTVTQALLDTVYVDAANGDDDKLGNTAATAVESLRTALNKVSAGGTIILQNNCDMKSISFNKNVTIKSTEDNKYTISTEDLSPNYIDNGITVTFDTVNLSNTKFGSTAGLTGPGNFVFNNCEGSGISITSGIADNITINNSNLSGTFYATTKLALKAATITGSFNAGQLDVTGSCSLNLKKNTPAVIGGDIGFEEGALITISTENLARGEKLIQVPKNTAESIVDKFELSGTENGKYALKCRETYNGTYIGISECISIDDGKLAVAYEPAIGNAVIDTTSNGSKYVTFNPGNVVGVTSGIWSGYSNSSDKKWSLNDSPELTIVLSAGMDSNFYHFDDNFMNNNLSVYSWNDVNYLPDYQNQKENVTIEKKEGQGVSDDGRTFTFTVTYPQVAKMAQTITGDVNDITANCGDEISRIADAKGTLSYESSDSSIVSVDANGKITAHKAGNATITVNAAVTDTYEAASVSYTVTVSHNYGTEYKHDDANHWKECACGDKTEVAAHSGGTADCVTKAKCEICDASYGTVDTSNHKGPMTYTENNSATHKKICDACKAVVAEESHNFVNNVCSECGYKRVIGGGGSYNPVQKPEIITGEGGKTNLENNGTTLVITPDEGMEISKVTVNGKEVTVTDNKLTGLKTGDKVEVTFTKIPPTKEEVDNIFKGKALKLELIVRTSKTPKKNIKAIVKETAGLKTFIKEIEDAGYAVKYKFYRSTKKSSKYEAKIIKTEGRYINTIGKKGTKYYYKAKLLIYDTEGNLIAQTELKQCKYGLRAWSK